MKLIVIILIIILIVKNLQYQKMLKENEELKEKLNEKLNDEVKEELNEDMKVNSETIKEIGIQKEYFEENESNQEQEDLEQYLEQQREQQRALSQKFKEEEKSDKEYELKNEKEQRNTIILITGAVCIVLSAIVFLMSTWNSIPNILKTAVLSLLTLVFLGGSYIAKEKFKLDKASQTFFYIAMAYIPICLLSISIFKLLGTYLSIYGEGKYIYLMFSSLFVAIIYYIMYINKNSENLLYGSLLFQIFSIIAFSLILSNDILIIGINLLLYNILLILLTKKDTFIKIYNFIPAVITFMTINMLGKQTKTMIFMLLLLVVNFLILELKNSKKIYSYMVNIFLVVFGIYTIHIFNDILGVNISHLFALSFVILLYIIENIILAESKRKNLKNSLTVVTLSTIGILHIESFINTSLITPYMISALQVLILIITYIKSKKAGKNVTATLIPIYFIITGINILFKLNCSYHSYIIFAFLTFIIGEFFRKRDRIIHLNAFTISHIFIALTYIIVLATNFNNFINNVFYAVLIWALYIYSYCTEKNKIFKYMSYLTLNFTMYTLCRFFIHKSEIVYYVPMISTLVIMYIEIIDKELKDKYSDIYLIISELISFGFIYLSQLYKNSKAYIIFAILFSVIIIINNIKYKNQKWNIIPLACVIPALFFNNLDAELKMGMMLLSVIATAIISIKEKNASIFTVFSGIYLLLTLHKIKSIYLKEILFACWSTVHFLFITVEKEKDVFKFLTYLSILFLYNNIIVDLQLATYTLFSMLGYVLISILTLKTILVKYIDNIDILEYIVYGIIYLIALLQYNNEIDGILFGFLIIAVVISSYIKKYGALFMVSIFAILVNIFILTREFWFSIPWWVYLLAVGAILIGFATKNEMSDKKSEINAIDLLKSIKDKIEK